jgi:hypothetical protein
MVLVLLKRNGILKYIWGGAIDYLEVGIEYFSDEIALDQ